MCFVQIPECQSPVLIVWICVAFWVRIASIVVDDIDNEWAGVGVVVVVVAYALVVCMLSSVIQK